MLIHASCAAQDGIGVLIRGPAGSGKSSLLLSLLGRGFELVADDCVLVEDTVARAPETLRGMVEVRGMGVYRRTYLASARIGLIIESGHPSERIATRRLCPELHVPIITLDLLASATCEAVCLAAACLAGTVEQVAGPV